VLVYGVVSAETEQAVELFLEREQAEQMVRNWDRDQRWGPLSLRHG
jgi:hypothetical protein